MSNEMIEKVARALYNKERERHTLSHADWCNVIDKHYWCSYARAAIEAMREPTDQQRDHYFKLKRESGSTEAYSTFEDGTWEIMIDACLKE